MAKKLTKAQQKVIDAMKNGQVIMRVGHGCVATYNFDGGETINRRTIRSLLARHMIKDADDSMFGTGSQTLVLV